MAHIPNNIDKVLFAEDLVVYVMQGCISFEFTKTAECYRNVVYNAFNETVCAAIDILISHNFNRNLHKFLAFWTAGMADEEKYKLLVVYLHGKCFSKGFEARKFLHFCAQLTSMAYIFYYFGIREVPKIAAQEIARILENYPMHTGAWGTVNAVAAEYCKIAASSECSSYMLDCVAQEPKETRSLMIHNPSANPEFRLYAVDGAIEVDAKFMEILGPWFIPTTYRRMKM